MHHRSSCDKRCALSKRWKVRVSVEKERAGAGFAAGYRAVPRTKPAESGGQLYPTERSVDLLDGELCLSGKLAKRVERISRLLDLIKNVKIVIIDLVALHT